MIIPLSKRGGVEVIFPSNFPFSLLQRRRRTFRLSPLQIIFQSFCSFKPFNISAGNGSQPLQEVQWSIPCRRRGSTIAIEKLPLRGSYVSTFSRRFERLVGIRHVIQIVILGKPRNFFPHRQNMRFMSAAVPHSRLICKSNFFLSLPLGFTFWALRKAQGAPRTCFGAICSSDVDLPAWP